MRTLLISASISLIAYLGFSFGHATFDISLWPYTDRCFCAWLMMISTLFCGLCSYLGSGKIV